MLLLSSNSRIYEDKDSGFHSFREEVWGDTDPKRCGDPGSNFWTEGKWTIDSYINKVLDAPVIFDVTNKQYKYAPAQPFRDLTTNLDLDAYIFHNSTMFTDIRIKDYIELRYLDNPTILLVPGMILLIENILSHDEIWKMFAKGLPYEFEEVPAMTQKLNSVNEESLELWNQKIKPTLIKVLNIVKLKYPDEFHYFFNVMLEKVNNVGRPTNLEVNPLGILERSTNQFNVNLEKLLINK